jgi:type III restriction enzyme
MDYLRPYQQSCVDAVTAYLKRFRELGDARLAFVEDTSRGDYLPVDGLDGVPYFCLKVPTGGGKTAIAAFCVKPLLEVMGQREAGPVLWLAPTTKIVDQTVAALKDKSHPYRQELDRAFDGRVTVCDVNAALYLRKDKIENDCTIIVTTIQSLRVEETEGRKVYEVNGELKHHFDGLTADQRDALLGLAEQGDDPTSPTFANVLRMHRPVVVVDEAHNARTDLSFGTLRRFGPSCILELTATPADDSNVLTDVSAARLKVAEMIKLPVMLRARKHARDAIGAAIEKRKELAGLADAERETHGYVRPIILYQAQSGDSEFNVEGVKKILVDECGIDDDRVAICTGALDELPDMPILSEKNPVEHIITVQKLREGWDCPFAYVLCSVASLGSRTAVEQVLGRVLRMPYAKERGHEDLNRAYCYATSQSFQEAATDLEDALVKNCGFSKYEARKMVRREPVVDDDGGLFGDAPEPVSIDILGTVDLEKLPEGTREHVQIQPKKSGGTTLTWTGGAMLEDQSKALTNAVNTTDQRSIKRLAKRSWSEDDAPASLGIPFAVPAMAVSEDGEWVLLEDQPLEGEWSLADCNHKLTGTEFRVATSEAKVGEFDVNEDGEVTTKFLDDLDRQIQLFEKSDRDTPAKLAIWLGKHVRDRLSLRRTSTSFSSE